MQAIITSRQEITGKNGKKYFVYQGIGKSGKTVECFLGEDQEIEFGVPENARATHEQLTALFKELPVIEVDFDQRGRLVSISLD